MTDQNPPTARESAFLDNLGCIQSAWLDALGTASGAWLGLCRDASAHAGDLVHSALAGRLPESLASDRAPRLCSDAIDALCNDYLRLLGHLERQVALIQEAAGEAIADAHDRWDAGAKIGAAATAAATAEIDEPAVRAGRSDGEDQDAAVTLAGSDATRRTASRRKAA
ncbi:MAG: hypothetical protein KDH15_02865 [Rhodocyclaceae bacterium]|nr:hypothetical protein [Rhodocyclaceae bacterium]